MFRSGEFISQYITPKGNEELDNEQIQPNGVDLKIGSIKKASGRALLKDDRYNKGEYIQKIPNEDGLYVLDKGFYRVIYDEIIEIPENHIGLVYPRSRLMRSGGNLRTAVWDSGYRGKGEGGLAIDRKMRVEDGMKIGQMVMCRTEELEESYDGTHQGENL